MISDEDRIAQAARYFFTAPRAAPEQERAQLVEQAQLAALAVKYDWPLPQDLVKMDGELARLKYPTRPLADPTETLALIAEHRLTVAPVPGKQEWIAEYGDSPDYPGEGPELSEVGPTIGAAVRACVARIRGGA